MSSRKNFPIDIAWFDENFTLGYLNKDLPIKEYLNNKRFTISSERISSRVLNHWHESGLLDDDRPDGKGWRKFSISEIIWIQIIMKLRNFGLDLKRIKRIKEDLDMFSKAMRKPNQSKCPLLDFYISVALHSDHPIKFLVFESGETLIQRQIDIDWALTVGSFSEDFIMIDLSRLVKSNLENKDVDYTDYLHYSLSEVVKKTRHAIDIEQVKSLNIELKSGDTYILKKELLVESESELNRIFDKYSFAEKRTKKIKGKKFHLIQIDDKIKK